MGPIEWHWQAKHIQISQISLLVRVYTYAIRDWGHARSVGGLSICLFCFVCPDTFPVFIPSENLIY